MEHDKNKKSRAFIITFIIVFLLLLLCYFLFANQEKIFGTKGSMSLSNIFSSLTGTSKSKSLKQINDSTNGTTSSTTSTGVQSGGGTNTSNNGGLGGGSVATGSSGASGSGGASGGSGTGTGTGSGTGTGTGFGNGTGTGTGTGFGNGGFGTGTGFGGGGFGSGASFATGVGFGSGGFGTGTPIGGKCQDKNASNYGLALPCSYPIVIPNPLLCQDKTATNYLGPIPCTYKNSSGTTYQCSDRLDNDNDGLVDSSDPGCHLDNDATNSTSYDAQLNNENNGLTLTNPEANMCPDDPLDNYYTEEEKAKLTLLRRKFYLIAPTIKSEDDINLVKNEANQNNALVTQSNELIKDCRAQKDPYTDGGASRKKALATPNYTGPTTVSGNPYWATSTLHEYLGGSSVFEKMFYVW